MLSADADSIVGEFFEDAVYAPFQRLLVRSIPTYFPGDSRFHKIRSFTGSSRTRRFWRVCSKSLKTIEKAFCGIGFIRLNIAEFYEGDIGGKKK